MAGLTGRSVLHRRSFGAASRTVSLPAGSSDVQVATPSGDNQPPVFALARAAAHLAQGRGEDPISARASYPTSTIRRGRCATDSLGRSARSRFDPGTVREANQTSDGPGSPLPFSGPKAAFQRGASFVWFPRSALGYRQPQRRQNPRPQQRGPSPPALFSRSCQPPKRSGQSAFSHLCAGDKTRQIHQYKSLIN